LKNIGQTAIKMVILPFLQTPRKEAAFFYENVGKDELEKFENEKFGKNQMEFYT
jgi:hypothetical protein